MNRIGSITMALVLAISTSSFAQLNKTFEGIFNRVLRDDLRLSPGQHGTHFLKRRIMRMPSWFPRSTVWSPVMSHLFR